MRARKEGRSAAVNLPAAAANDTGSHNRVASVVVHPQPPYLIVFGNNEEKRRKIK